VGESGFGDRQFRSRSDDGGFLERSKAPTLAVGGEEKERGCRDRSSWQREGTEATAAAKEETRREKLFSP